MTSYHPVADLQHPAVYPAAGRLYAAPAHSSAKKSGSAKSLARLLDLRSLPADVLILLAYIVLSRAYIGDEDTLGIKLGPIPLFITDAMLMALIAITMSKRSGRLLNWAFGGSGAGKIGRATWLLFMIAVVYAALAFPQYKILAVRDLAIFGYCIFFPLTYFALAGPNQAAKFVRYFIYATCLGAVLFNFQNLTGVHLFALTETSKGLPGHHEFAHLGAGNLGGDLGAALAGLFAYMAVERKHQAVHFIALLLCFFTLAQLMDRSAFLGFAMAGGLMFVLNAGRARVYLVVVSVVLGGLVLASSVGELPIPGGPMLHRFWIIISNGTNFQSDPDGQFRLQRWGKTIAAWETSPVFGVGFGGPVMLDTAGEDLHGEATTAKQRGLGAFNVGMPHNTFLVVLARTGPFGLGLVCFAWFGGILLSVKRLRQGFIDPDLLAATGILVAMLSTAGLNLFFERPMLCAPFWIMLAVTYKLSENLLTGSTRKLSSVGSGSATMSLIPSVKDHRVNERQAVGGWQARWK